MQIDTINQPVLSDSDVAVINAARSVLSDARQRAQTLTTHSGGAAFAMLDVAEDGLFNALNWISAHGVVPLTDDQIHNRP